MRVLSCASAAWVAYQLVPFAVPYSRKALLVGTGISAAASLAWPPLAGATAIALVVAALFATPTALSISLGLIIGALGVAWWVGVARQSHLSGPALLAPLCVPSPAASVGPSAFALSSAAAFFTGAGGFLLYVLTSLGKQVGFDAELLAPLLRDVALEPRTWVMALAYGLSALAGALIAHKGSPSRMLLGQVVSCLLLVGTYVLASHMENGNIATALDIKALVIALSLGATLCIVCALAGEGGQFREGDK